MNLIRISIAGFLVTWMTTPLLAQRMLQREQQFLSESPKVGDPLPDVPIFRTDGTQIRLSDLRGHVTVLTFGCLTCPPSMWAIPKLEAVHRDYHSKGVEFYYIFKSLAHPELSGNYVQPFTQQERLQQARRAVHQFGTRIPWLVDTIDNQVKHALGDRPNSQFIVDTRGVVINKRAWSDPSEVRADLEKIVGKVDPPTRAEDLSLNIPAEFTSARVSSSHADRTSVDRIKRNGYTPIMAIPNVHESEQPFYAKLRAEAAPNLLRSGKGKLYLGFHLDPLYSAHWNNLNKPLQIDWHINGKAELNTSTATATQPNLPTDHEPREFLIAVSHWPQTEEIDLTVRYFACLDDGTCQAVHQRYTLRRERDADAGGARGQGAGYWETDEFSARLFSGDRDRDGKLSPRELPGLFRTHFTALDVDQDGQIDRQEIKAAADWVNHWHRPGSPQTEKLQRQR